MHLLLIDASGFAYRAYHAMPVQTRSDGMSTHAILGYMAMVWRLLSRAEADPYDYAAAVFDSPGKTFRHRAFPEYKAGRSRPADLLPQLALMREASRTMGIEPVELKGFEADDVIATLATRAKADGIRTTIVTVDKDMSQLVEDDVVEIVDPVQRVRVLAADVLRKFGVVPALVPDVQALCGDAVDGIPGVPGLGIIRAAGLIRRYGSLAELLKQMDKGHSFRAPPSIRSALRKSRSQIPVYRRLAVLRRDAPVKVEFEALRPRAVMPNHLSEMLRALEAEPKLANMFGSGERRTRTVDRLSDPLKWWADELKRPGRQLVPDIPQCGFYRRRLVKGGVWVAARIWREPEQDFVTEKPTGRDILQCEVAGQIKDAYDQWGWLSGQPIKEDEYKFMLKRAAWAKQHAPTDPYAAPETPIDWNKVDI